MGIAFALDPDFEKKWGSEKNEGSVRWFKLVVEKEKIKEGATGEMTEDPGSDMDAMLKTVEDKKLPFFLIFRLKGVEGATAENWCQVSYVPDDCQVKLRMPYAGAKLPLKKALGGNIACALQASEIGELKWAAIAAEAKSALGPKKEADEELMTEAERHKMQVARELAEDAKKDGGAIKPSGAPGINFPLSASAKARMEAFAAGEFNAVAFKIDGKPEELKECDNTKVAGDTTIEDVAKTIDTKSESRYVIFRSDIAKEGHVDPGSPDKKDDEEEGDGETKAPAKKQVHIFFIYFNSSGTPVKRRMLYSASKKAAAAHAEACGCGELKVMSDFDDLDDLTTKSLQDAAKPEADRGEEEQKVVKPKPKGKGPRMLIA